MNKNIKVASLTTAHQMANGWAEQVISLVDANYKPQLKFGSIQHLLLKFDDVVYDCPSSPTLSHIKTALEFARHSANLVVHCHAGLCRSTAVAFAILVKRALSATSSPLNDIFEAAIETVLETSPDAWPNELIIKHADDILQLNGDMIQFMSEWKDDIRQEGLYIK